jgi:predicted permease
LEDDVDDDVVVDDDEDEVNYRNNSHWKKASTCGLSNYVSYYDAASLYPSSGITIIIIIIIIHLYFVLYYNVTYL